MSEQPEPEPGPEPERERERDDHLIIGSGLNALVFAAELSRCHPGQTCRIFEKHSLAGGYATNFQRRESRFDCSLHKLSGINEHGNVAPILKALGLWDELTLRPSQVHCDACFPDQRVRLSSHSYEEFQSRLRAEFPHEREGLSVFFRDVEVHGKNGYHLFQILKGEYVPDPDDLAYARRHLRRLNVSEAFEARFTDPRLRAVLAGPCLYVGGFPEDLSYQYYLHLLYSTLVCGNAYVQGGSQALSDALVRKIEAAGSQVHLRTEVARILVDGERRAFGVETSAGTFLGRQVHVNAAPQFAVDRLLPAVPGMEKVRERLTALKPSFSTTTVYLQTDQPPDALGLDADELMVFPADPAAAAGARARWRGEPVSSEAAEAAFWHGGVMQVTNYHRLDPGGGPVVCLNVLDAIDHWPQRKTMDYKRKKQRARQGLVDRAAAAFPGLLGHIAYAEASTPHTYARYTNNHRGAGYGALVGTDARGYHFHRDFPIQNVHFLSAWVAGPTYEAAFGYGQMAAHSVQVD
jgi:phytoene dehydrogenase-like protein